MNRNNIWVHIGLAVVFVTLAAVLGQIERWRAALRSNAIPQPSVAAKPSKPIAPREMGIPEVLVRFKLLCHPTAQ